MKQESKCRIAFPHVKGSEFMDTYAAVRGKMNENKWPYFNVKQTNKFLSKGLIRSLCEKVGVRYKYRFLCTCTHTDVQL